MVLFASISRSEWIELWAGVLGAIPASVISAAVAAGVAVTILGRTNEHQQMLSAKATKEQRDTAFRQMDVQQNLAVEQLAEQRKLSERQLAEQKKEASLAREQLAIAEVLISTEAFVEVPSRSREWVEQQLRALRTAVARWRAELGDGEMQFELFQWTTLFTSASLWLVSALDSSGDERVKGARAILSDAMSVLGSAVLTWQAADPAERQAIRWRLTARRLEIQAALTSSSGVTF